HVSAASNAGGTEVAPSIRRPNCARTLKLASVCYDVLQHSGLLTLARRLSSGGVILCYHNVVAETNAGASDTLGLHMPLPTFERQMRWLARNYEVVQLAEFVDRSSRRESLRGVAALTFDDAYS